MSFTGLFLALGFVAAAPAVQADPDVPSRTVSFADLDLTTSAGQARLRSRLASEIVDMCGGKTPTDLGERRARRDCVQTASRSAEVTFTRAVADAKRRGGTQMAAR